MSFFNDEQQPGLIAVRLTATQIEAILTTAKRLIDPNVKVWLFGSRVDNAMRGGDIDLLVESETIVPNRAQAICRMVGALSFALGDRKIDIILKDARTQAAPIFDIAKRTGVIL